MRVPILLFFWCQHHIPPLPPCSVGPGLNPLPGDVSLLCCPHLSGAQSVQAWISAGGKGGVLANVAGDLGVPGIGIRASCSVRGGHPPLWLFASQKS